MRFGVLTSGGDCPGLNAVLRAVARCSEVAYDDEAIGFKDAWQDVECEFEALTVDRCRGILPRGGTILGTSRVQPYQFDDGLDRVKRVMADMAIDGFIVIGGEGSLAAANQLNADGVPCIGVPKTIDNDVEGTDVTFGFDTAVSIASDSGRSTADHIGSSRAGDGPGGDGTPRRAYSGQLRNCSGERRRS